MLNSDVNKLNDIVRRFYILQRYEILNKGKLDIFEMDVNLVIKSRVRERKIFGFLFFFFIFAVIKKY